MRDFQVRAMFERIAFSYDFQNSFLSLGCDVLWRRKLARLLALRPNDLCIDAAVGTGEVSFTALAREPAARLIGVDFSPAMLRKAQRKQRRRDAGQRLELVCGDCRALPLADGCADVVTISFGIRNIAERVRVLEEFRRVLKPGGRVLVMEFGFPKTPVLGALYRFYFTHVLPPVGNFISRTDYAYTYLIESVTAFPNDAAFLEEMRLAGFAHARVRNLTLGVAKIFSATKLDAITEARHNR